jgi:hypothetical protein
MGKFLEAEKRRQATLKAGFAYFTGAAHGPGCFRGKPRDFCLPEGCADENLYSEIRQHCKQYFSEKGIRWHMGENGSPSVHLCDSQVCCVNFLFPFVDKPAELTDLLRPILPDVAAVIPMEPSGEYVSFEWIGQKNYLREKTPENGSRTRGANCTSADAAVMFETTSKGKHIALIEWKYTESYGSTPLRFSSKKTDRCQIYRHLYASSNFPLKKEMLASFETLFYEPFYQLFRQQCLASEMEMARELGADKVFLLHIAPARNADFKKVTSPELRPLGEDCIDVWKKLVAKSDRFLSVSVEHLFGRLRDRHSIRMRPWWQYLSWRYSPLLN